MSNIRAPDEDIKILAEKDYMDGMKYKDIAAKYKVSLNTIKSWKQRYNWNRKSVHTNKKVCTQNNNKNLNKKDTKEPIVEEVNEVLKNAELTDKQRLFCIYYIKYFNATKAYKKAYGCSYETAMVNGFNLLRNTKIESEIEKLKQHKLNQVMLSEEDIFQRYMDIAFSDIGDYLTFKKVRKNRWIKNEDGKDIPVINPDTGEQDFYEYNVVELNDSKELDTSILQEVSEGKDGVKIKLQDKMKALQWLADHMGIATDKQKVELEVLKSKLDKKDLEPITINFVKASERNGNS